ncbi:hypothetical protein PanWU01x14_092670 [Parasponia andersonii]|uniref:Uncharacterized protein n=1 Tax=Parasponia andersonii TaxID=3476 RepID=A0A2P5D6L7_PARAD|nr:hypothetical protein PanWU01x14_092670 [Parasponia andersonii]
MGSEASNQLYPDKSLQIPEVKQPAIGTSTHTTSPISCGLSPNYKGSSLYDSYELQAVVHQLNKAIQGSKAFSPPYIYNLKSPFYRKRLNRIYRENRESPKTLTCSNLSSSTTLDDITSNRGAWMVTRGVVTRLWEKVKRGLQRSKQSYKS